MLKSVFRYVSAFVMLVLYVAVLVTGDVMALTCECKYHKADEHTVFQHIHHCESGCCTHSSAACDDVNCQTLAESCTCNHIHSTEVNLYTHPRVDDGLVRQTILLAILTDVTVTLEVPSEITSSNYNEYILPAIMSDYVGNCALRAPPVLV